MTLSFEQNNIISHIMAGHNMIIDSISGSGKTMIIKHIASAINNKKILVVTYNSFLKLETRHKCNVPVETYHSLHYKYYKNTYTDHDMLLTINNTQNVTISEQYDIIIIDEAQDMTTLYLSFIKKFISDMGRRIQLILMGDVRQCIYKYKDPNMLSFVTDHRTMWPDYEFIRADLNMSYRLTPHMTGFINECSLTSPNHKNHISSHTNSTKVHIYIGNFKQYVQKLVKHINKYVRVYGCGEIFILIPSVKYYASKILENSLVDGGHKCFVPSSDDFNYNTNITDKIVFCTYHQSKGRERKVVIMLAFDRYHNNGPVLSNLQYVALTRASKELVCCGCPSPPMFFNPLSQHCNIMYYNVYDLEENNDIPNIKFISVTDMTKIITLDILKYITFFNEVSSHEIFTINEMSPQPLPITYNSESISDITGVSIPIWWFTNKNRDISEWMRKVTKTLTKKSGYKSRILQLPDYNWLSSDILTHCSNIFDKHIVRGGQVEKLFSKTISDYMCYGKLDYINNNIVWEFKCTNNLTDAHKLQLMMYIALTEGIYSQYNLLNIYTSEMYSIVISDIILSKCNSLCSDIINIIRCNSMSMY